MNPLLSLIVAAAEEEEIAGPGGGFGIGSFALILAIIALLLWMGYLVVNSRRSRDATAERLPPNQTPYMSDDELENVRTTKVLGASVVAAALLAIILPWYAFNESDRAAEATVELEHLDIEEGEKWFVQFECFACHGEDLGGGATEFIEPRSGVVTSWQVPSLNDILFRYDESEVRFVIEFGRSGTPMPANGLEGGGSLTLQEVDQLIAYIGSKQIPQAEVVARADRNVELALLRIESGEAATQIRINQQQARIDSVTGANDVLAAAGGLDEEVLDLLGGAGTCTETSAEMALTTCDEPGGDTDRDGLTDAAEPRLTEIAAIAYESLTDLAFNSDGTANELQQDIYDVSYDPSNAFTNTDVAGHPVPDLETAELMLAALQGDLLLVGITAENEEDFLEPLGSGMDFLLESAELMLWSVDFDEVSEAMSEVAGLTVSEEEAERAVGLFNGYCARCHTGGFSAGSTFEVGPGRGAWGPAINDARTPVQFPDVEEHIKFIITGTDNAAPYGVNGIGTGRMPGFGASLTAEDIKLIALYERTL
jgi:mono/diheme cytochrome c family protein